MLTISITLLAGFAVFGYVNSQAGANESQYGQAVGQTVEYLEERFVVTQFAFTAGTPGSLTIYLYNNGKVDLRLVQIEIYNSSRSLDVTYTAAGATDVLNPTCTATTTSAESPVLGTGSGALDISEGSVSTVILTLPSCLPYSNWGVSGVYYASITAQYGNQVAYYEVD